MEQENRIATLILKQLKGELEEPEVNELNAWINEAESNNILYKQLTDPELLQPEVKEFYKSNRNILEKINSAIQEPKVIPIWKKFIAAASIILVLGISSYFFYFNKQETKPGSIEDGMVINDVAPGHDGAILTLADGREIVLDNAQDGKITDVAVKIGNKISYENSNQTKVEYNTMTTPKGRQFSLVLPDGSQVWLNAASSITYPTAFIGSDRKVSITGEAYFEVAHDSKKPFHVTVNGMEVQVLGTYFNINSYGDQGIIKTTLLLGSVRVSAAGNAQTLKPGQQAQVANNNIKVVSNTDVDAVMAWKNGFFSFEETDIKGLMKEISRWYDVEVIYQGEPKDLFSGEIDRNLTLTQVLKGLADTKVKYRIEDGKRLVILP